MRVLLLLLTAAVGLSGADLVFKESPPSTPVSLRFSDPELACVIKQKLLHSDGKCYKLRQRGPCAAEQWLVMDSTAPPNTRRLVCKNLPCNQPLRVYWPGDGQCHKFTDKSTLCPYAGNDLTTDSYGEGMCACAKVHARLDADVIRGRNTTAEWEGDCHALYERGPCPAGKVLLPVYMEGFGVAGECSNDPCSRENTNPRIRFARRKKDGRCYQLGARGPCPEGDIFDVYHLTNKPQCFDPRSVNTLSLYGDSAARCDGNVNAMTAECREELVVNIPTMPFVTAVTGKRRKRRAG